MFRQTNIKLATLRLVSNANSMFNAQQRREMLCLLPSLRERRLVLIFCVHVYYFVPLSAACLFMYCLSL